MTIARGVGRSPRVVLAALCSHRARRRCSCGGGDARYDLVFQNAGQLVKDDDVQVGGRRIGSIREIKLTDDNQARVHVKIQEPYAPLHEGTTAIIRPTSLSGIANRYIALTPGAQLGQELDDGATLAVGATTTSVDLDQLFNALDPETRKGLQEVIQGFAAQYEGKGKQASELAEYFNPFLSTSRLLVNELTQDEQALTDFIVDSSRAVTAVAERRDDLTRWSATPTPPPRRSPTRTSRWRRRSGCCRRRCAAPTPRSSTCARRSTTSTCWSTRPSRRPRTSRRSCASCARSSRSARPTIKDLRKLVTRPGTNNDLLDATRKLPQLQKVASPTFAQLAAGAAEVPAGARVHPALRARAHRLVPRLRAGRPPTTTPTATSPASRRSSTPSSSMTTRPAAC